VSDQPWLLPEGWRWATVGDLCRIDRSKPPGPPAGDTRYVGLEHMEAKTGRLLPATLAGVGATSETFLFDTGCILYGRLRPNLNKVALPEGAGVCSTDILPLRPRDGVERAYLGFAMRSSYFAARAGAAARGQLPRISVTRLGGLPVPLPPPDEQRAISRMLLQFAGLVDRCADAAAAVERLPLTDLERRLVEAGGPGNAGWRTVALGELASAIDYGLTVSAAETLAHPEAGSHRYVRITDIDPSGRLKAEGACYLSNPPEDVVSRYHLSEGDLLFARSGFSIGNTYLYNPSDGDLVFASYVIRARVGQGEADPQYVATYLQSPESRDRIRFSSRGAGKPNLSTARIANLRIPIPPDEVQREVVELGIRSRATAASLRLLKDQVAEALLRLIDRALGGGVRVEGVGAA